MVAVAVTVKLTPIQTIRPFFSTVFVKWNVFGLDEYVRNDCCSLCYSKGTRIDSGSWKKGFYFHLQWHTFFNGAGTHSNDFSTSSSAVFFPTTQSQRNEMAPEQWQETEMGLCDFYLYSSHLLNYQIQRFHLSFFNISFYTPWFWKTCKKSLFRMHCPENWSILCNVMRNHK